MMPYDPSMNGLMNWQRLSRNADEAHDAYAQKLEADHLHAMATSQPDPFYTMKLSDNDATRPLMNEWAPFNEALAESGATRIGGLSRLPTDSGDAPRQIEALNNRLPPSLRALAGSIPTRAPWSLG